MPFPVLHAVFEIIEEQYIFGSIDKTWPLLVPSIRISVGLAYSVCDLPAAKFSSMLSPSRHDFKTICSGLGTTLGYATSLYAIN